MSRSRTTELYTKETTYQPTVSPINCDINATYDPIHAIAYRFNSMRLGRPHFVDTPGGDHQGHRGQEVQPCSHTYANEPNGGAHHQAAKVSPASGEDHLFLVRGWLPPPYKLSGTSAIRRSIICVVAHAPPLRKLGAIEEIRARKVMRFRTRP